MKLTNDRILSRYAYNHHTTTDNAWRRSEKEIRIYINCESELSNFLFTNFFFKLHIYQSDELNPISHGGHKVKSGHFKSS